MRANDVCAVLITLATLAGCSGKKRPFADEPLTTSEQEGSGAAGSSSREPRTSDPELVTDGPQPAGEAQGPVRGLDSPGAASGGNANVSCAGDAATCTPSDPGAEPGACLPTGPRDCTSDLDNNCDGQPDSVIDDVCLCVPGSVEPCDEHPGLDGRGECHAGTRTCLGMAGGLSSSWGACEGAQGPQEADSCVPGDDADCDGLPNEGCACVDGLTQACGPNTENGACQRGTSSCINGAFGLCQGAVFPERRDCSSVVDNDCDGRPDNTIDGFCSCSVGTTRPCDDHPGRDGNGPCQAGEQRCEIGSDGATSRFGACNGSIGPSGADSCTLPGDDSNCNGVPNDNCGTQGSGCGAELASCGPGLTCVDGLCCNSPCQGDCESCSVAGICQPKRDQAFCGPGAQCDEGGVCEFTGIGMIAAGTTHTCAITRNGNVRCWGQNLGGILGYGHTENIGDDETPLAAARSGLGGDIDFGLNERVHQISAGHAYTCALFETGRVRCWAGNESVAGAPYERVGTLDIDRDSSGLLVPSSIGDVDFGGLRAVQIHAGEFFACAALENGSMGCWGPAIGLLGTGSFNPVFASPGANVLLGNRRATQAVMGSSHTCALIDTGEVTCWGVGGTGNNSALQGQELLAPPASQTFAGGRIVHLTAGIFHSCSVSVSGTGQCWGHNEAGQLGYSHSNNVNLVDHAQGGSGLSIDVGGPLVQIEAPRSLDHTCALLQNGSVLCWGANTSGELGYGHNRARSAIGGPRTFGLLGLDQPAVALADGARCAVMSDRSIRCWGTNFNGVLGQGRPELLTSDANPVGLAPVSVEFE